MKKNIFYVLVALTIGMFSCKKTDNLNPLSDYSNFKQGAYITLKKAINYEFNFVGLDTSKVGVRVLKYPNGVEIDSIILYVASSSTTNKSNWKLVKAQAFTVDSLDLTCTGTQLATALGVNISTLQPGSQFFFYNRIVTKEGLSYDVTNIGQSLLTGSFYKVCLQWTTFIVCPYNATDIFGNGNEANFQVVVDGWEDWVSGDVVPIYRGTKLDPNKANAISLRGVYGEAYYFLGDLVAIINPTNGSTNVPGVTVTKYSVNGTNYSARGYGGGVASDNAQAGYIFSCTGYIGLTLNWYSGTITNIGTNFGPFRIILQKL